MKQIIKKKKKIRQKKIKLINNDNSSNNNNGNIKKETVKKPRDIPVQESNPQLLRDIQMPNSQDQQLPQNKHYKCDASLVCGIINQH